MFVGNLQAVFAAYTQNSARSFENLIYIVKKEVETRKLLADCHFKMENQARFGCTV
jgi:hypothetical protein